MHGGTHYSTEAPVSNHQTSKFRHSNCIGIFVSIQFLSFFLKTSFVSVLVFLRSSDGKVFTGS
jgi:hypothetical protein